MQQTQANSKAEAAKNSSGQVKSSSRSEEKININTADPAELDKLPGVGPATAAAIVEYRQKEGQFQSIEDLKKVSGIGEAKFKKFADRITI